MFAILAFLAGCGGEGGGERVSDLPGAAVFKDADCGSCPSLGAAFARGTIGPDLDSLRPSAERVAAQVRSGGNGMPAFAGKLSDEQIRDLAEFVARAASAQDAQGPEPFEPDDTKVADCEGDAGCYIQAFGNLAYREGPAVALERFERGIRTNPEIERTCHPIAHRIGAGALAHTDGNVGRALADGTAACGSGFYHGLLENKLSGVPEDEVGGVAREVCTDQAVRDQPFLHYQCVHGLGHGLMLYTRYDLPRALDLCRVLEPDSQRVSCTGGVFMENQQSSYGIRSKWLDDKELLYPCPTVAEEDKLYCYLLVTSQILPKVGWDWKKTAEWCNRGEERWIPICFQSMGRDASGAARQEPDGIRERCRPAGSMEHECLFGAARDILNNDAGDRRAGRLCDGVREREIRAYCYKGIGTMVGTQHRPDRHREVCRSFARGRDVRDCRAGTEAVG